MCADERNKMAQLSLIPAERIEKSILLIRGQKVLLDRDLAELYEVPIKRLNEQVRRNLRRFPDDFMFQPTADEATALRSQFATLKTGRGQHRKFLPYTFTEQGVAMLSSVLNSDRAIEVNIAIMRAFVRLRKSCPRTRTSPANSTTWSESSATTTRSSPSFSRPSANSWRHRPRRQNDALVFDRMDSSMPFRFGFRHSDFGFFMWGQFLVPIPHSVLCTRYCCIPPFAPLYLGERGGG